MKAPILVVKKLPALGMAIFPFILLKDKKFRQDEVILNHEKIHLRQQLELFILPFYILYLLNYLYNRIKFKNHDEAYKKIIFEKEAYLNDGDLNYLSKRKSYAWLKKT